MPRKRLSKITTQRLKALRRALGSAPDRKPQHEAHATETTHGASVGVSRPPVSKTKPTARRKPTARKPRITERDVKGLKYFSLINPLLEGLHECGTERDVAGNRILHYDQYCSLVLLFYFTPIVDSLRGIQQASQLGKIQKNLGCSRASLGSLSEAARVFDSGLLRELIPKLAEKLLPTARGKDAEALRGLIAVDGSLLPALPKMAWALWMNEDNRAAKMHVHFDARIQTCFGSSRRKSP